MRTCGRCRVQVCCLRLRLALLRAISIFRLPRGMANRMPPPLARTRARLPWRCARATPRCFCLCTRAFPMLKKTSAFAWRKKLPKKPMRSRRAICRRACSMPMSCRPQSRTVPPWLRKSPKLLRALRTARSTLPTLPALPLWSANAWEAMHGPRLLLPMSCRAATAHGGRPTMGKSSLAIAVGGSSLARCKF